MVQIFSIDLQQNNIRGFNTPQGFITLSEFFDRKKEFITNISKDSLLKRKKTPILYLKLHNSSPSPSDPPEKKPNQSFKENNFALPKYGSDKPGIQIKISSADPHINGGPGLKNPETSTPTNMLLVPSILKDCVSSKRGSCASNYQPENTIAEAVS